MRRNWITSDRVALGCTAILLLGAARIRLLLPKAVDAAGYHAHIHQVADGIPLRVGDWVATDDPIPKDALDELQPNVMISRHLRNVNTGQVVALLLVQCKDVRDLAPHYPPVCYPGQGLTLTSQESVGLKLGAHEIPATRYTFESNNYQNARILRVDNFMVLPDGGFQKDMQGMERRIGADQRYFGAGQVQIVFTDTRSEAERTEISESILHGYEALIEAISKGVRK